VARTTHGAVCTYGSSLPSFFFFIPPCVVTGPAYARDKGPEVVMKGIEPMQCQGQGGKTGVDKGTWHLAAEWGARTPKVKERGSKR
jgi:hypothetical protein